MYLVVYEGRRTRHMSFSMESADHAYALAVAYVAKNPGQYDKMFLLVREKRGCAGVATRLPSSSSSSE